MALRTAKVRWVGALIALFFAMLVVAPAFDAAACGVEIPASHASSITDVDADADQGPAKEPLHGGCAHGHCHHGSAAVTPGLGLVTEGHAVRDDHAFPGDDLRVSRAPSGLERPPRA